MNIEQYRDYCLAKPGVTEGLPFDNRTLVFKVMGKMFALIDIEDFEFINLKCDPDSALGLRANYPGIRPGYHMNKQTWNSVYTDGNVPDKLILELTDHSYEQVVLGLTKKLKEELAKLSL